MLAHDTQRRLRGLKSLVGNTPILAVEFLYRGEGRVLYAKADGAPTSRGQAPTGRIPFP